MNICIIGGGGQIAESIGAMLIQKGCNLHFYRPDYIFIPGVPKRPKRAQSRLNEMTIISTKLLSAIDKGVYRYKWSSDADLEKCDVFIFAMPSYLAEKVAIKIAPFLSRKILINISDRFLGTYAMAVELSRLGLCPMKTAIALNSPPLIAYQPVRDCITKIYYDKAKVLFSCFPRNNAHLASELLAEIFDPSVYNIQYVDNMLYLAFENTQSIVHAVQDLDNLRAGRYEICGSKSRYDAEAYTSKMVNRINCIVKERDQIADRLLNRRFRSLADYDASSGKLNKESSTTACGTAEFRQQHSVLNSVPRPSVFYAHGYEDIGWSLVPLESFGVMLNVSTPYLSALISEWSGFMGINYRLIGRTVSTLHLMQPRVPFMLTTSFDFNWLPDTL